VSYVKSSESSSYRADERASELQGRDRVPADQRQAYDLLVAVHRALELNDSYLNIIDMGNGFERFKYPDVGNAFRLIQRALLPSQGGEAVEVAAWVTPSGFMHKDKDVAETHPVTKHACKAEPLMTVAQHNRIVAAQRIKTCIALKERNDAREALTAPPSPDAELASLKGAGHV
jgi:hypothetical protein